MAVPGEVEFMRTFKTLLLLVGATALLLPVGCTKEEAGPEQATVVEKKQETAPVQPDKERLEPERADVEPSDVRESPNVADVAAPPTPDLARSTDIASVPGDAGPGRDTTPATRPDGATAPMPADAGAMPGPTDTSEQPAADAAAGTADGAAAGPPADAAAGTGPDVAARVDARPAAVDAEEAPGDAKPATGDAVPVKPLVDAEKSRIVFEEATKFIKAGKLESATLLLEEWLMASPMDLVNRKNLIHIYMKMQKYEKAELHLRFMTQEKGDDAEWWGHLGRVQGQLGKYSESTESLGKAWELDPEDIDFALDLAKTYEKRGELDAARMVLQGALKLDKKKPEVMRELATVLVELGEFTLALRQYRKLQRIEPTYSTALLMATLAAKYKKCDDVVDSLVGWDKKFEDESPLLLLANCALEKKNPAKAEKLLKAGLEFNEKCFPCALKLGDIYFLAKDWDGAIQYYGKAAPLMPKDHRAFVQLGKALANSGKHIEASRAFAAANERSPGDAEIVFMYGIELVQAGQKGEAWKVWGLLDELDKNKAKELRKLLVK